MQLNNLSRKTKNKKKRVVGRGGKHAKTSGRGTKGQKARAGHSIRPAMRDAIKKIPKKRGHGKNRAQTVDSSKKKMVIVSFEILQKAYDGKTLTPKILTEMGVVSRKSGRVPQMKILANGKLDKKISVSGFVVSGNAKELIEKAGGEVKE